MVGAVRHAIVEAAHPADALLQQVLPDFLQRIGDADRWVGGAGLVGLGGGLGAGSGGGWQRS